MRSFRQIIHGCKKHKYRFIRDVRWYEDEYREGMRSKWICMNCMKVIHTETTVTKG